MTNRFALGVLTNGSLRQKKAERVDLQVSEIRDRSDVREQKHVIKETSVGSGEEGHRGLSWVCFGMFWSVTGVRLLSWKFVIHGQALAGQLTHGLRVV